MQTDITQRAMMLMTTIIRIKTTTTTFLKVNLSKLKLYIAISLLLGHVEEK